MNNRTYIISYRPTGYFSIKATSFLSEGDFLQYSTNKPDQCRSNTLAKENNPATSPSHSEDKKAKPPEEMSFTQKKEYFENLSKNPDSTGTSQNGLKKK